MMSLKCLLWTGAVFTWTLLTGGEIIPRYRFSYQFPYYEDRLDYDRYGGDYGYGYRYRDRYPDSETKYIGPEQFPGKFLGNGKVNLLYGGRDAELICTLSTRSNLVSNTAWTKIESPYPSREPPSFRVLEFDDYRMTHHNIQGSSVILIRDVRPEDFGVYRCVGTSDTGVRGDTETVFQIIEFFRN